MQNFHFVLKKFQELSPYELYEIIRLRVEVFVVEQNCVYQDLDNKDLHAHHLMLFLESGELAAHTRILPSKISYPEYPSIGRVVSDLKFRSQGFGRRVMEESLHQMEKLFPGQAIKISAQSYLLNFYSDFGFTPVGEEYMEDNIPHTAMIRHWVWIIW